MERVKRHDKNLAEQMRRAATSVALNLAEAQGVFGGSRRLRVETALGSAREVLAALRVADAFGYCETEPQQADFDRLVQRLVGLRRSLV